MFFKKKSPELNYTDVELLASYKVTGDLKTLGQLYERYMEMIFAISYKYLKNQEESQDAVMQIFEHLVVKLRTHDVENFRTWIHTVVRNYCFMILRADKSNLGKNNAYVFMENTDNQHPFEDVPFEIDKNEMHLDRCIEKLPLEQKTSIRLFYLQEKCYQEITDITGFELNKVKSYIQNGKRNLKICLEKKNG
ncbi:MAG: RNA polymerase sigma factor [Leadbetterella sp.]